MISVCYVDDLDVKLINEVLEIDSAVYPQNMQGTFDEVYQRFRVNRDMFILMYLSTNPPIDS